MKSYPIANAIIENEYKVPWIMVSYSPIEIIDKWNDQYISNNGDKTEFYWMSEFTIARQLRKQPNNRNYYHV